MAQDHFKENNENPQSLDVDESLDVDGMFIIKIDKKFDYKFESFLNSENLERIVNEIIDTLELYPDKRDEYKNFLTEILSAYANAIVTMYGNNLSGTPCLIINLNPEKKAEQRNDIAHIVAIPFSDQEGKSKMKTYNAIILNFHNAFDYWQNDKKVDKVNFSQIFCEEIIHLVTVTNQSENFPFDESTIVLAKIIINDIGITEPIFSIKKLDNFKKYVLDQLQKKKTNTGRPQRKKNKENNDLETFIEKVFSFVEALEKRNENGLRIVFYELIEIVGRLGAFFLIRKEIKREPVLKILQQTKVTLEGKNNNLETIFINLCYISYELLKILFFYNYQLTKSDESFENFIEKIFNTNYDNEFYLDPLTVLISEINKQLSFTQKHTQEQ